MLMLSVGLAWIEETRHLFLIFFLNKCLALGNQLVCFPLEKTTSMAPSFPWLPAVLCVGLRSHGHFPVHLNVPIVITLVQLVFGHHFGLKSLYSVMYMHIHSGSLNENGSHKLIYPSVQSSFGIV